jgi:hypothetical protein
MGTFEHYGYPKSAFTAEFQITSDINVNDGRVYLKVDGFYKKYADRYIFSIGDYNNDAEQV